MEIPHQRWRTPWLPVYLALSIPVPETLAQEPGVTPENRRESTRLEAALVTATRRVANVQTVPLGISVIRIGVTSDIWSTSLFVNNLFEVRGLLFAETGLPGKSVAATRPGMIGVSMTRSF